MQYQLLAHTSHGDTLDIELDADDATHAVTQLAQLVTAGQAPTVHSHAEDTAHAAGTLRKVYARPLDG